MKTFEDWQDNPLITGLMVIAAIIILIVGLYALIVVVAAGLNVAISLVRIALSGTVHVAGWLLTFLSLLLSLSAALLSLGALVVAGLALFYVLRLLMDHIRERRYAWVRAVLAIFAGLFADLSKDTAPIEHDSIIAKAALGAITLLAFLVAGTLFWEASSRAVRAIGIVIGLLPPVGIAAAMIAREPNHNIWQIAKLQDWIAIGGMVGILALSAVSSWLVRRADDAEPKRLSSIQAYR